MDGVIEFIKKNAKEIEINAKFFNIEKKIPKEKITAIDGGSSIIVDGGRWAIGLVRIGKVSYLKKKIEEKKEDYWVGMVEDKILVEKDGKEIKTPVKIQNVKKPFETAIGNIRKYLEWSNALEEDIVLLDSRLKPIENWEIGLLKKMKKVVGISKTTREGINGRSFIGLLHSHPGIWYAKVGDLTFAKFNENAKHIYLVDGNPELFPFVSYYSNDPEILGYPYPLIRVDKIARIQSDEKRRLNFKIKQKLGKLKDDVLSQDMHSLLDKRMYR